jgi:plasmid stabilization system protein ParE
MSRPVLVAAPAQLQIQAIDAWWRANRSASPELFAQELADAFSTIGLAPHAGQRYRHADVKGVRRVPLRATRNHVYYVPTEEAVLVLAVWGAVKGAGPDLASLEQR